MMLLTIRNNYNIAEDVNKTINMEQSNPTKNK